MSVDVSEIVPFASPPTGWAAPSTSWDSIRTGSGARGRLSIFRNGTAAMNKASGGSITSKATARAMPPK